MISVLEICSVLDNIGCGQDPIYYKGFETTPGELACNIDEDRNSKQVRIMFYGLRGKQIRKRRGTLFSMAIERMMNA